MTLLGSPGPDGPNTVPAQVTDAKSTRFLYLLASLSAIGGFLFGYDTGVVSGAMLLIKTDFEITTVWHEAIVAGTVGAAWIFALVAGQLSDRMGRRPVILVASCIFAIGSIVMGSAPNRLMLFLGRMITGVGIGIASMIVPMYLAEVSLAGARGYLLTLNTVFVTGGQFIAAIICGAFAPVEHGWRFMLGFSSIPALVQLVGFYFMPESPRFLVSKGKSEEAKNVLIRIRGAHFPVDDEIEQIQTSYQETQLEMQSKRTRGESTSVLLQILGTPSVRRALFLGCALQTFQQISGINTVMYYSASIFQMAGFQNTHTAIWLSALTAGVNFFCTFIGLYLVEKLGRRSLTLSSLAGVVLSLAFLGVGFLLSALDSPPIDSVIDGVEDKCILAATCGDCLLTTGCGFCFDSNTWSNASCVMKNGSSALYGSCAGLENDVFTWTPSYCPSRYAWITVLGLVLYLFFFAPGMGPMPWTINAEIYPMWARGTCTSIATSCNWFFNLLVSMTFLSLTHALTSQGAFFFYAGLALVGLLLFTAILPETRGRPLEEVQMLFERPWSCDSYCRNGCKMFDSSAGIDVPSTPNKAVQYVRIKGLNRDYKDDDEDGD